MLFPLANEKYKIPWTETNIQFLSFLPSLLFSSVLPQFLSFFFHFSEYSIIICYIVYQYGFVSNLFQNFHLFSMFMFWVHKNTVYFLKLNA